MIDFMLRAFIPLYLAICVVAVLAVIVIACT